MVFPSTFRSDDFRFGNLHFVAFAPHHLDQDGELQFPSSGHFEAVHGLHFFDADGDIAEGLLFQAGPQMAGGHIFAVPVRRRERYSPEKSWKWSAHRPGWPAEASGSSASATVSPIKIPSMPARATISPALDLSHGLLLESFECKKLGDSCRSQSCRPACRPRRCPRRRSCRKKPGRWQCVRRNRCNPA